MKEIDYIEVNETLYIWFRQAREISAPTRGPILQEKALNILENLKKTTILNCSQALAGLIDGKNSTETGSLVFAEETIWRHGCYVSV